MKYYLWILTGLVVPLAQALWTNRNIRDYPHAASFDPDVIREWIERIKLNPEIEQFIDQIYSQESDRRNAITTKAQATLASTAFIVASLSLAIASLGNNVVGPLLQPVAKYYPIVGVCIAGFYLLCAFIGSFRAIHVQRYLSVELQELQNALSEFMKSSTSIGSSFRARKVGAVIHNGPVTLKTTNYIDAAISSLRNFLVVIIFAPALVWLIEWSSPVIKKLIT